MKKIKKGMANFNGWKEKWEEVEIISKKEYENENGKKIISYLVKRESGEVTTKIEVYEL